MKSILAFSVGLAALAVSQGAFAAAPAAAPVPAEISSEETYPISGLEKFATCGSDIEGAAVDARGNLWLTDPANKAILKVDASGACKVAAHLGDAEGYPAGARFAPDGSLVVVGEKAALRFDPATGKVTPLPFDYEGKPLTGFNDLAIDARGGIYVTIPGGSSLIKPDGKVFYRDPSGKVRLIAGNIAYPNGIALTRGDDEVLVSEMATKRIISLPAVTTANPFAMAYVYSFTAGGIGVDGMEVDRTGTLFGANYATREILVYDPFGHEAGAITLPAEAGIFPTSVAVDGKTLYVTEADKGVIWRIRL